VSSFIAKADRVRVALKEKSKATTPSRTSIKEEAQSDARSPLSRVGPTRPKSRQGAISTDSQTATPPHRDLTGAGTRTYRSAPNGEWYNRGRVNSGRHVRPRESHVDDRFPAGQNANRGANRPGAAARHGLGGCGFPGLRPRPSWTSSASQASTSFAPAGFWATAPAFRYARRISRRREPRLPFPLAGSCCNAPSRDISRATWLRRARR